jgi:hypothetical protein
MFDGPGGGNSERIGDEETELSSGNALCGARVRASLV